MFKGNSLTLPNIVMTPFLSQHLKCVTYLITERTNNKTVRHIKLQVTRATSSENVSRLPASNITIRGNHRLWPWGEAMPLAP